MGTTQWVGGVEENMVDDRSGEGRVVDEKTVGLTRVDFVDEGKVLEAMEEEWFEPIETLIPYKNMAITMLCKYSSKGSYLCFLVFTRHHTSSGLTLDVTCNV